MAKLRHGKNNSYVVMAERMNLPRQNLVLPKKTKWKNCGGTILNLPFTAYWKLPQNIPTSSEPDQKQHITKIPWYRMGVKIAMTYLLVHWVMACHLYQSTGSWDAIWGEKTKHKTRLCLYWVMAHQFADNQTNKNEKKTGG